MTAVCGRCLPAFIIADDTAACQGAGFCVSPLDKSTGRGYNKHRKGVAGRRLAPHSYITCKEVTAKLGLGRLLLFMGRNEEADNADDNQRILKQFRICNHWAAPLSEDQRARSCLLSGGANRLPLLAALKDSSFLLTVYYTVQQNAST